MFNKMLPLALCFSVFLVHKADLYAELAYHKAGIFLNSENSVMTVDTSVTLLEVIFFFSMN
jgi:hypothetical protein